MMVGMECKSSHASSVSSSSMMVVNRVGNQVLEGLGAGVKPYSMFSAI